MVFFPPPPALPGNIGRVWLVVFPVCESCCRCILLYKSGDVTWKKALVLLIPLLGGGGRACRRKKGMHAFGDGKRRTCFAYPVHHSWLQWLPVNKWGRPLSARLQISDAVYIQCYTGIDNIYSYIQYWARLIGWQAASCGHMSKKALLLSAFVVNGVGGFPSRVRGSENLPRLKIAVASGTLIPLIPRSVSLSSSSLLTPLHACSSALVARGAL